MFVWKLWENVISQEISLRILEGGISVTHFALAHSTVHKNNLIKKIWMCTKWDFFVYFTLEKLKWILCIKNSQIISKRSIQSIFFFKAERRSKRKTLHKWLSFGSPVELSLEREFQVHLNGYTIKPFLWIAGSFGWGTSASICMHHMGKWRDCVHFID